MEPLRGVLKVSVSHPYGVETFYPRCALSKGFARLLGQKTLTKGDVELIKGLGFEFVQEEVKL